MSEQIIAGRYELGERLGLGGMSTVHLAVDARLHREVAIKLLAEHLADDPAFVERFRREALAAARLVHPNVVGVFDFGLDEDTGRHYIVMEYVRGPSVAEILRERARVSVQEALSILSHACRGLDYAHRHGVVHRDVKPGNLLRSEDNVIKLADFGIAKALDDGSAITQVGSVLGTAAYLAPEQARGHEAGPAADLYALGVVAYQLLSGHLPYEATSLSELVALQEREAPPLLHELVDGVTPQLAAAVDRALSLDPRERQASAEAMRAALVDGARGTGPGPEPERTDETRVVSAPPPTSRTQVVEPRTSTPAAGHPPAVRRLEPRPARRTAPGAAVPGDRRAPRRRRGAGRRIAALLAVAAIAGAGILIAVDASQSPDRTVQLRDVSSGEGARDTVTGLRGLIDDNTQ